MKAVAKVLLDNKPPEVLIIHNGESISFNVSVFGKASFSNQEYDVFNYLNLYWVSMSDEEQQTVFNIYKDIQYAFDALMTSESLRTYLSDKVTELLHHHDLVRLQDFVSFSTDIKIPHSFKTEYIHDIDNNTTREKTYIRSDYIKLVTLSLSLQSLTPIWGEYISNIRHSTGNAFKEFYAFQLLNKSEIIHSPAMEKLRFYIEHIIGTVKYDGNNTLNSISSEDFGYHLLGLVCVRRLCAGDIRGVDEHANLITLIYKFVIQRTNNDDNNFENVVREKKFDDRGTDADNKISTLERYKIKTNISLGSIVELEHSVKDIRLTAHRLCYNLDPDLLERSIYTSSVLINERILDPQMVLLRWIFKPVISARGLMYLPQHTVVEALGALEAILWTRGHKYLAIMATSHMISSDKDIVVSPMDSKMRVPEELTAKLESLYPFSKPLCGKKSAKTITNGAAKSIDILTNNMSMFSWKPTADSDMLEEVFGTKTKKFPVKPDVKIDLTKLVIELGERSW